MRRAVLKGEVTWQAIVAVVIVAIAAVVLLMLLGNLGKVATQAGEDEQCTASVRSQALRAKIVPGSAMELRCPTKYVTVTEKELERQKLALAREMASCWHKFGQGSLQLFDVETGQYCAICSRVEFTTPSKLDHFTEYLAKTKRPTGGSYYEYLFNVEGTAQLLNQYRLSPVADQDTIDTSRPLAVVYVAQKNVDRSLVYYSGGAAAVLTGGLIIFSGGTALPIIVAAGVVGGAAGAGTGYVAAPLLTSVDYAATTIVWPYDQVCALKCSKLEGKAGPLQFVS